MQPLETQVLAQLERIIDPDFGMSVVACGFIKDMAIDAVAGVQPAGWSGQRTRRPSAVPLVRLALGRRWGLQYRACDAALC